ncbi:Collagen triple helix repeat-containing protein 1 [Acropora cervicornis]|uniref:Collagen triple helix repeat-containing protein 1 n=1 Tax=Acropora cervicornis TaxID=6130 RepID=A0AAD9VGT7_ACRCE|nr:Collagen triple helix repeat-containing protein 1 [Acropora cervicornis]
MSIRNKRGGDMYPRNWRQCVYKNLNDGRDTGLIKVWISAFSETKLCKQLYRQIRRECLFYKKSADTALRVFFNGVLRIYGCHACCSRWYFTFNGAECSAPQAIDGVVYMVHGNAGRKNLLRVRQIEGVCERVPKGIVRVGFSVGNCAGYGTADAYTGWNSVSRIYVEEVPPPHV